MTRGLMLAIGLFVLLVSPFTAIRAEGVVGHLRIAGASPVKLPDRPIEPRELETFLDGVIAGQFAAHRLSGAALVVVKDGEVVLEKGYGYSDLARRVAVDPVSTRFTVGSVSKLMVWTAVMQLVERGRLDLDADVNQYLVRFQIEDSFDAPVTLRRLLTHTAGFEEIGTPFAPEIAGRYASLGDFLAAHLPKRVLPPAHDFAHASMPYSNWGALLAAHIVEVVSGERFDRYAARNIFQPLGMAASRFQTGRDAGGPNRAAGHAFQDGAMKGMLEDMTASGPAGALIATVDDIAKFMIAHLEGGGAGEKSILGPQTTAIMQRRSAQSSAYLDAVTLGFMESYRNGRRTLRHDGSTQFTHSELVLLPEEKLGLFVTYNSHEGGYARRELVKAFFDRYFPATIPVLRSSSSEPEDLSTYAGNYRSLRRSFTTYEKLFGSLPLSVRPLPNGSLLVAGSQWQKVAPDTFRNAEGELLAFNRDTQGAITSLNLRTSLLGAERIAWYQNPIAHVFVVGLAILSGLLGVFVRLKKRSEPALPMPYRWAGDLAAGTGFVNVLSCLAFASVFAGGLASIMNDGPPSALYAGLWLALASFVLTTALAGLTVIIGYQRYYSRRRRLFYSCSVLVSGLYLTTLAYWNLIGFHLG